MKAAPHADLWEALREAVDGWADALARESAHTNHANLTESARIEAIRTEFGLYTEEPIEETVRRLRDYLR